MESKNVKIQIKNRWVGNVIFEYECADNSPERTILEAVRQKVSLCDADLRGANLCGAGLCDADLSDADLSGADLRGAGLCDADLSDADLSGADLRGANLCGADLSGADLRGANLRGADLRDADLRGAVLDYNDRDGGYGDTTELVRKYREDYGLELGEIYQNHDTFSSRWGAFWRNLIIIRQWEFRGTKDAQSKPELESGEDYTLNELGIEA